MENTIEAIEEMKSMLERQVEWPLSDVLKKEEFMPLITEIYANLQVLQLNAELINEATADES